MIGSSAQSKSDSDSSSSSNDSDQIQLEIKRPEASSQQKYTSNLESKALNRDNYDSTKPAALKDYSSLPLNNNFAASKPSSYSPGSYST